MSCPHSAWLAFVSQPICRISATRGAYTQHRDDLGTVTVRLFEASLTDSRQDHYFSADFLPAMAADHSSMSNKLERSNVLTMGRAKNFTPY